MRSLPEVIVHIDVVLGPRQRLVHLGKVFGNLLLDHSRLFDSGREVGIGANRARIVHCVAYAQSQCFFLFLLEVPVTNEAAHRLQYQPNSQWNMSKISYRK